MICKNLSVSAEGHLLFAGQDAAALLKEYGSPLYLFDENRLRENCQTYYNAMKEAFGEKALPLYASKAASFKEIYRIVGSEGLGIDVVSSGEIYTAKAAGFPLEKAYFHSNNKTDEDIAFAMENGIGYFVVDNEEELFAIDRIAAEQGICQKVLLRLTPGIDTHTYEAINTGKVDSKFGSAIETGQADAITKTALDLQHLKLMGFHCHVGSQVFDSDTFFRAADIMLAFIAEMAKKYHYTAEELDLGGGYGVRYLESDPQIDIAANIHQVAACVKAKCAALGLPLPSIRLEPGRSIVADAGMTLYTVGTIKQIPGYKNYVSVDGGMTDNPRFALYGASYTVVAAEKMNEEKNFTCSVVGRCCESGDILQEQVNLPASIQRGDILAVLTTGAYNFSMASNYNRIPRLPVVMLKDGTHRLVVKRETLDDIIQNDI
ncbi:MAG: diaminopimelate decarboxylase [Clostridia bacterium]|nr:diaminopimelate decarboxylase [Clostridia bacterium]